MKTTRKILLMSLLWSGLLFGGITLNACNDDSDCEGFYVDQDECEDAISGVSDCRCEFENGGWAAVPN